MMASWSLNGAIMTGFGYEGGSNNQGGTFQSVDYGHSWSQLDASLTATSGMPGTSGPASFMLNGVAWLCAGQTSGGVQNTCYKTNQLVQVVTPIFMQNYVALTMSPLVAGQDLPYKLVLGTGGAWKDVFFKLNFASGSASVKWTARRTSKC